MDIDRLSVATVGVETSLASIPSVTAYAVAVAMARDGEVGRFEQPASTAASAAACIRDQVQSKVEISTAIATTPSRTGIRTAKMTKICPRLARLSRAFRARRPRSRSGPKFAVQYGYIQPKLKCTAHAESI